MINRRVPLVTLCLFASFMLSGCGGGSSSSSTGNNGGGGVTTSGLQFTSPKTGQTLEVGQMNPTISLTVNQPVTWSLASGCLHGMPVGTLSNETATTATYNGPMQAVTTTCPSNPTDLVVATSTTNTNQSTTLSVVVVQTPPCIGTQSGANVSCGVSTLSYQGTGNDGCVIGVPCCPQNGTVIPNGHPVGVQYNLSLSAGFGIPPYTWQMVNGSTLPTGLSLAPGQDTTKMSILGTPASPGCSAVQLQVTDSRGVTSTPTGGQPETLFLAVVPPPLKVQVPSYPWSYNQPQLAGDPGVPYPPTAFTATGGIGPLSWSIPNSGINVLPPGLNLTSSPSNSTVAVVSGTPASGAETGNSGSGSYPAMLVVNDTQLPYPAYGSATLGNMGDAVLSPFCSPAGPSTTNVTIPPDLFLQGSYAFLLRGSDANGPVVMAGSLSLDGNGNVTSGVEDVTRSSGAQTYSITSGSYTVGVKVMGLGGFGASNTPYYNRGCITITTSAGTTTFAMSLGSCSNGFSQNGIIDSYLVACGQTQSNGAAGVYTIGRMIEFDDSTGTGTRTTGILRMQDTSSFASGLSGRYAFGLAGWDSANGHYAVAGSMQAGGGSLSAAAADIDDAGTLASQLTGGSGTFALDSANPGRGTATLKLGQSSFDLALYIVSKNELFLLSTDPLSAAHPVIGGEAVPTASAFTNNSLKLSHMFHIGGLSSTGPDVSLGVLNFDGIGSFTGTEYEDQAATISTASLSGAFAVDPATGRTAFTAPTQGQNLGAHPFVAYLAPPAAGITRFSCSQPASCITGFLVGTDSTAQDGILEFQTPLTAPPPPFTNRYVVGDYIYGTDENLDPPPIPNKTPHLTGSVFATASSTSSTGGSLGMTSQSAPFFQDVSYGDPNYCVLPGTSPGPEPCLLLFPVMSLSGSYSIASNGTGTFGAGTVSVSNGNILFYIDESPLNLHPSIIVAEQ